MEEFQFSRQKANEKIKIAEHILDSTFPFVKDPRLLVGVMDNIFLALTNAMNSVLYYERLFKRIPQFKEDFKDRFEIFKSSIVRRYKMDIEYVTLIQDIRNLLIQHKKSSMEFSRGDKFVICTDEFRYKTISVNDMKKFISKSKQFIHEVNNIVQKDERIFR